MESFLTPDCPLLVKSSPSFPNAEKEQRCRNFLQKTCHVILLNDMHKHYVRLHLDYGDITYIPDSICEFSHFVILSGEMERLESIQYSAALALTGIGICTSREKRYDELGRESLHLPR